MHQDIEKSSSMNDFELFVGLEAVATIIEASLALRLRRQSVLTRAESPADLWWVVEEQALRRPVGGPAVPNAPMPTSR